MATGRSLVVLTREDDADIVNAAKEVLTEKPGLTIPEINDEFKARGWGDVWHLPHITALLVRNGGFVPRRENPDEDERWYWEPSLL